MSCAVLGGRAAGSEGPIGVDAALGSTVAATGVVLPLELIATAGAAERATIDGPAPASLHPTGDEIDRSLLTVMGSVIVLILFAVVLMLIAQRRLRHEIARRKAVEENLLRSNDLLRRTGRLAKVGGWELDIVNDRQMWTEEAARIREIPPDSVVTHEQAMAFYAPEERAFFVAAWEAAIRDGTPWEHESLLTTARGRKVWVHGRGEAVVRDGKTVSLVGVLQDITDRKLAENALARANGMLKTIIDTSPLRIFWKDKDSRFLGGNPLFA